MSIADRVRLSYVAESTFGTFPSSTLVDLRFTGESFSQNIKTARSAEIGSDRQVADLNFELTYGTFDPFFEAALLSGAFPSETTIVSATDNKSITFTSATGNVQCTGAFSGVAVGDWIRFKGLTAGLAAMNNQCYKVLTVTDTANIIIAGAVAVVGGTQAASLTANGVIVKGSTIKNGTTLKSFAIEKQLSDVSSYFLTYTGMTIDQLVLNIAAEQLVTGTFSFVGVNETKRNVTSGTGYTAANTNEVMNCIENVLHVIEGTPAVNTDNRLEITELQLTIANGLRPRKIVGGVGPDSFGYGKCSVSGSCNMYFENQAAATKFLAFTETSLAFVLQAAAGTTYLIEIPKINFTAGPRVASGENTDIMLPLTFDAKRDPTLDATIRIVRWAA